MNQKLPILTKLVMWRDYITYVALLQKEESLQLGIEIFLFLLSIYLLKQELFPTHGSGAGEQTISIVIVLVIIKFLWEMYNTKKQVNSYFNIQHSILRNTSNTADMLPSPKERKLDFSIVTLPHMKAEKVFVSESINRYIQTTPLAITLSDKKKVKIFNYLQKHKDVLLQYLNYYFFSSLKHNREFTNNQKLCMSSDITLHTRHVECHTGGYYDSFLTNQISGTTLVLKDEKHTTMSTEEIFPSLTDEENNTYLTDITSSPMNHHIGCSTIGFTKDHMLILWVQGESNQFSGGLLNPTGSGSANAADGIGVDFQHAIISAMERELREESISQSHSKAVYETKILGFFRWVSRGGKPEFVGITKLPEMSSSYQPNTKEVHVKKTADHLFSLPTIDSLPKTLDKIRASGQLSVPLFMCLRELEYMYAHHKEELSDFLFGNS